MIVNNSENSDSQRGNVAKRWIMPVIVIVLANILGLWFLYDTELDYRKNEYVIKGRGVNTKVVHRSEDPEHYDSRMKWWWTGYVLLPTVSILVTVLGIRRDSIQHKAE